jgi:hypothetical protein
MRGPNERRMDSDTGLFTRRWIARMINDPIFLLSSIPEEEKTYENCLYAVKHCHGQNLQYVPMQFRTEALCWEAIKRSGQNIDYVPEELRTYELYLEAAKTQGGVLNFTPPEFQTYELCEIAVRQNGTCLEYVPLELLDIGLYRLAIESGNPETIGFIPDGHMLDQLKEEYPNFFDA